MRNLHIILMILKKMFTGFYKYKIKSEFLAELPDWPNIGQIRTL